MVYLKHSRTIFLISVLVSSVMCFKVQKKHHFFVVFVILWFLLFFLVSSGDVLCTLAMCRKWVRQHQWCLEEELGPYLSFWNKKIFAHTHDGVCIDFHLFQGDNKKMLLTTFLKNFQLWKKSEKLTNFKCFAGWLAECYGT